MDQDADHDHALVDRHRLLAVSGDGIRVVALGGSTRPGSTSERALAPVVAGAEEAGARVEVFSGRRLMLPIYDTEEGERTSAAAELVRALSSADGLIISAPGYHGSLSGMMKNALDYTEDLKQTNRIYLDGIAVGCIGVASGWQAAVSTLHALRTIVHALRGWPTPLGVAVNSSQVVFDAVGRCRDDLLDGQLREIGSQVVRFARMRRSAGLEQFVGSDSS